MKNLLLLLFLTPFITLSQVSGTITEDASGQPLYGAKITASTGERAITGPEGKFSILPSSYPVTIIISAANCVSDTLTFEVEGKHKVKMGLVATGDVQVIKTVVVTAGRRNQNIEDVSISMEVIKPQLIENKGIVDLEQAVDQSPGVYAMDGSVSIRGGSGFAYGAGSRTLVLWNGIPLTSADAGDVRWTSIPLECASQIEVIKGASSVLYGSGALNGIISLTESEPTTKGEFRAKIMAGIYENPRRESLKWWSSNPMFYTGDVYYGKMYKKFGYTVSLNAFTTDGYKEGEVLDRARVSGSLFFRPIEGKRLKLGLGYNVQYEKNANFIIWESDTFAYTPSGGADLNDPATTLTVNTALTASFDPYLKAYDKKNNLHVLKGRYYYIDRANLTNPGQSTTSTVIFGDYQFQKKWGEGTVLTTGLTGTRNGVVSALFGDHNSMNFAIYTQYEKRWKKLDITGGVRLEYFQQDGRQGDSDFYFGKDTTGAKMPIYPIARLGLHYQVARGTHLRASFGQGIRYPSVAERYTKTSVGALNIFPNENLGPETGWAAEIGVKQVFLIGKKWKGMLDLSGFINQYNDMMEFTFGVYVPDGVSPNLTIGDPNYVGNYIGFRANNAEQARIIGAELSFNSAGQIGDVEVVSLIGYTYMNPVSLNQDSNYLRTLSTYDEETGEYDNTLKYRFNHLVKADIEATWKGLSVGFSARYVSAMKNIDKTFEEEAIAGTGIYIMPGLKEYRVANDSDGSFVMDARIGYNFLEHYRVGFMVNNILNNEYVSRPGDVQPPRSYMLQLKATF
ncbi:MAG: TonB-dependent receptor [Crocinitomicaceae bacterium]|nr:TonB-dependent receptor [Crocinitomicaceae bacterium]